MCNAWRYYSQQIFTLWRLIFFLYIFADMVEPELLHTYSRIDPYDTLILCVRVAVLTAVTLTVPIVLFPVSLLPNLSPAISVENHIFVIASLLDRLSVPAGTKSHPADAVSHQGFQLVASHCHCPHSAHFHQHVGDFCSEHFRHLWHHW